MWFEFTEITHISVHHFKLFSPVISTPDEKVRFLKENKLKVTQVELHSFFVVIVFSVIVKIIQFASTKDNNK